MRHDDALTAKAVVALTLQTLIASSLALVTGLIVVSLSDEIWRLPRSSRMFGIERDEIWFNEVGSYDELFLVAFTFRAPAMAVAMMLFILSIVAAWSCMACAHRTALRAYLDWLAIAAVFTLTISANHMVLMAFIDWINIAEVARKQAGAVGIAVALLTVSSATILVSAPIRMVLRRSRERRRWTRLSRRIRARRKRRRGYA